MTTPIEQRLQRCREAMGTAYACHPSRQVKRLAVPLESAHGTDIRKTFAKAVEKYERGGK